MVTNIQQQILKELDTHKFGAYIISTIMNKLNTKEKENEFLSYMISKRNIMLTKIDVIDAVKQIAC